ncbi:MAG: hypothetical protein A3G34_12145 [Candidatus Lindowbacteria bacterium RIFCSPLOWO2_12_FULL_62_27]|nr:MAG: hypothetical protein A3G34_12145 [Candidatus Lindowbacteria bacterium RIFCSPLOWO2_12_FULL_62_27]OGH63553.1 MAG: hypothetical protein A3I06_05250 [Candidatus Lindowbacteria bacterium RIFCSPLOWO2_02_FULL_62_12]
MGLPGGEMVDEGIRDLSMGRKTIPALLISIAFPRLRRQGVALPKMAFPRSDVELYRLLEKESGDDLAHARYTAHLRRISSFADALDRLQGTGS